MTRQRRLFLKVRIEEIVSRLSFSFKLDVLDSRLFSNRSCAKANLSFSYECVRPLTMKKSCWRSWRSASFVFGSMLVYTATFLRIFSISVSRLLVWQFMNLGHFFLTFASGSSVPSSINFIVDFVQCFSKST